MTISEFLVSVGFKADDASLKTALTKVGAFGAAVSVAAGFAIAGIMRIAEGEKALAAQAEKLGMPIEKLEELGYVAEQTGSSVTAVASSMEALLAANPRIKDAGKALETVGRHMAGMNEQARKLYAQRMGIDPTLIPMLTADVSALKDEFAGMYAVAGTDAQKAAEDSKGFLAEIGKLKTLSNMLAKSVGLAFIGQIRRDVENLRRVIMENFDKIKRLFETVIGVVLRVAGVVGAFVGRVVKWAAALIGWYDRLDDGQKRLVQGVALLLAAWKLLNAGFLATPLGLVVAGLAGIVALVDDYLTYMEGGESYFDWGPWAETIQTVVGWLREMAPALLPFLKALAESFALTKAVRGFSSFVGTLRSVTGGVGLLGTAFKMLWGIVKANPLGILLTIATLVYEYWEPISAFFVRLWNKIAEAFPDFATMAEDAASALRQAFGPVIDAIMAAFGNVRDLVVAVFTGDLSGALDAAKNLASSLIDYWVSIFQGFADTISALFSFLWGKVGEAFPDFAGWAEGAASSIKDVFGPAIQWVKDKIAALTDFLPDWVKERLGLGAAAPETTTPVPADRDASGGLGRTQPEPDRLQPVSAHGGPKAGDGPKPEKPSFNAVPPPSGPLLIPSHAQGAALTNNNSTVDIKANTTINVNGAENPTEVARKVAGAQNSVNADIVRHAKGTAR